MARSDALIGRVRTWAPGRACPPLIVSARPPYFIEDIERWPRWLQWLGRWGPEFMGARFALKASHGYPPDTSGMHGILYARGSGVARGRQLASVRAIDLHPTVARLLGIEPGRPVDGEPIAGLLDAGSATASPAPGYAVPGAR